MERVTDSLVPDCVPIAGATDLRVGATVSTERRYRLLAPLGEGGMGRLFRALDTALSREVALKFIKPDVPPLGRERFVREIKIGASLSHPNLVPVFDRGILPDGGEWMAMELLDGCDLGVILDQQARLGVPMLVDVFTQILGALEYVHERRIVHRDIKPDNVFISHDARCDGLTVVKLIDFGIGLRLDEGERPSRLLVGDPRYMSPEQTSPSAALDGRSDLYSVGLSLYEAATGRHPLEPFVDGPVLGLLDAHRTHRPPPPSRFLPADLPARFGRAFDAIVARACAPQASERYPAAAAMREEVAALAELARPVDELGAGDDARLAAVDGWRRAG